MTDARNTQQVQKRDTGVADARKGTGARVQFTRHLATLPYDEQVAAVKPGGMMQPPSIAPPSHDAPVQRSVDRVQMAGGSTPPASGSAPAAGGPPSPATLKQRLSDIMGVTTPPITAGADEPPVSVGPGGTIAGPDSDTNDPIKLKAEIVSLTKAFLAMDEGAPKEAKLEKIKEKWALLRPAMAHARGEENKLVQVRVTFEKFLGEKATNEWREGVGCVEKMIDTAKAMLVEQEGKVTANLTIIDQQVLALPDAVKTEVGQKIGGYTNQGFAGVVGKNFDDIIVFLTLGTLVQKAVGLINFTEFYVLPKLMEGAAQVTEICKTNMATAQPKVDLLKLIDSAKGLAHKPMKKKMLQSPEFMAKLKGGDMDAKIPLIPVEMLNDRQLDFLAKQGMLDPFGPDERPAPPVDLTGCDTKEKKIKALKDAGIHGSKAPGGKVDASSISAAEVIEQDCYNTAMEGLTVDNTAYIEGRLENMVDPNHAWIMKANQAKAPLKAGISGTTARFVGAANLLGGDKNGAAVAMLGHLQAIEAHSFWEIVEGACLGMSAGRYTPFPPNPGGMLGAADKFLQDPANGFADLGPKDRAKAQKVLLGES